MQQDKSQQSATLAVTNNYPNGLPKLAVEIYRGTLNKSRQFGALTDDEYAKSFAIWLRVFCSDFGLKEPPKEQAARIASFLKRTFAKFTFTDLKAATEMLLTGQIEGVTFYGAIDLQKVCYLLNKYKAKRGKMLQGVRAALPESAQVTIEDIERGEHEYWNRVNEMFEAYKRGESKGVSDVFLNLKTYETMKAAGLISLTYSELKRSHILANEFAENRLKERVADLDAVIRRAYREQYKTDGTRIVWVSFILTYVFNQLKQAGTTLEIKELVEHELSNYSD